MNNSNHTAIAIIGAGIGGLTLANGLKQKGVEVTIFEKDLTSVTRGQGYRLTINEDGNEALKTCLPQNIYQFLVDTSGKEGHAFTIYSHRKKIFKQQFFNHKTDNESLSSRQVDRGILRSALLAGVKDNVVFGKTFSHFQQTDDNVAICFEDGSIVTCDLLIGADGAKSNLRKQLLPGSPVKELGINSIYGRTPFVTGGQNILTDDLIGNGIIAVAATLKSFLFKKYRNGFFMASIRFKEKPSTALKANPLNLEIEDKDDYIMWAVLFPESALETIGYQTSRAELYATAVKLIKGYNRDFATIIAHANPDETLFVPFLYAEPAVIKDNELRVTLLGDAMHLMPPAGANGANTALQDAFTLYNNIQAGIKNDAACLRIYEREMIKYATEKQQESLAYLKKMRFT